MLVEPDNNCQPCVPYSSIEGFQRRPTSFKPTPGCHSSFHHQFGVSTTCPLHSTHFSYSSIRGSAGKWFPVSSLYLPACPWKNCSTSGPSTGGDPRSNSASSSSLCRGLCDGESVGLLSSMAWQCLWLHPQDLLFHWS